MYGIIIDALDVLVGCSVIDALVDVVTYISRWRVMVEIVVYPLINFLVVTTIRLMGSTTLTSILITGVAMRLLVAVIIVVPLVGIVWR